MPVTSEEKPAKVFMIIQIRKMKNSLMMMAGMLLLWAGCSSDYSDEAIAPVTFSDQVMNLSLPEYADLNSKGFKYISGGVRGIIIVKNGSQYRLMSGTVLSSLRNRRRPWRCIRHCYTCSILSVDRNSV